MGVSGGFCMIKRIDWSSITPERLEELVARLLPFWDFLNIEWHGKCGNDRGRDITCIKYSQVLPGRIEIQKWVIQCKRYTKASITIGDLSDFFQQVRQHQPTHILLVVTNTIPSSVKDWIDRIRPEYRFSIFLLEEVDISRIIIKHQDDIRDFTEIIQQHPPNMSRRYYEAYCARLSLEGEIKPEQQVALEQLFSALSFREEEEQPFFSSLIAGWPLSRLLNQGTGSIVLDISPNCNDALLVNGPMWSDKGIVIPYSGSFIKSAFPFAGTPVTLLITVFPSSPANDGRAVLMAPFEGSRGIRVYRKGNSILIGFGRPKETTEIEDFWGDNAIQSIVLQVEHGNLLIASEGRQAIIPIPEDLKERNDVDHLCIGGSMEGLSSNTAKWEGCISSIFMWNHIFPIKEVLNYARRLEQIIET